MHPGPPNKHRLAYSHNCLETNRLIIFLTFLFPSLLKRITNDNLLPFVFLIFPDHWFSNFVQCASESPEGLVKTQIMCSSPRVPDSLGLEGEGTREVLRTCSSDKFPNDGDAAGLGNHTENHSPR